jgi:uncharacterized protein YqgV (UPF0045/DUF77 family)
MPAEGRLFDENECRRLPRAVFFHCFILVGLIKFVKLKNMRGTNVMAVVNLGFQVLPKVPDHMNVYEVVDKAIEVVQASGVKYEVGALETVMEGEMDELLEIVKSANKACVDAGAIDVMISIRIHYRPDGVTMEEKLYKYR